MSRKSSLCVPVSYRYSIRIHYRGLQYFDASFTAEKTVSQKPCLSVVSDRKPIEIFSVLSRDFLHSHRKEIPVIANGITRFAFTIFPISHAAVFR